MRNVLRGISAAEFIHWPSGQVSQSHVAPGGRWDADDAQVPAEDEALWAAAPQICAAIATRLTAIRAAFAKPHRVDQSGATRTASLIVGERVFEAHATYGNKYGWGGFILAANAFEDLIPSNGEGPYLVNLSVRR